MRRPLPEQTEETNASAETESQEAQAIPEDAADDGGAPGGEAAPGQLGPGLTDRQARRSAHWRERATSAEARAERLARREVLRLLGERVTDPEAALTLDGGNLADLLDEDGDVDAEAVAELADRVAEARPYLRNPSHHMDLGPKRTSPGRGRSATWGSLVKGR